MNDIGRNYLYDNEMFSTLLIKCRLKKEANLEKGALTGKLNTNMAIFSLKQLGWKNNNEEEVQKPSINITFAKASETDAEND